MERSALRGASALTGAGILVAASMGLPAAAGPDGDAGVVVTPSPVAVGDEFRVEVSGCTGGQRVQVRIEPASVITSATCEGTAGAPGFAAVSFLAAGPLSAPGAYDVIVSEVGREIARALLDVRSQVTADKETAKHARIDAATTTTTSPVASTPTTASQDPAAESDDAAVDPAEAGPDRSATTAPTATATPTQTADVARRHLAATGPDAGAPAAAIGAVALLAGVALIALTRARRT